MTDLVLGERIAELEAEKIALIKRVEKLTEALTEISIRHIPDQPSALDIPEADFVRSQHTELRRIALSALQEDE